MKREESQSWQDAFRSNMTRITFSLTLTRAMLEFLCATADDVEWDRWRYGGILWPNNFLATEHALTKRGLVQRKSLKLVNEQKAAVLKDKHVIPCELTPVGLAVVEMLRIGGMFIPAEEALERLTNRRGRN